MEVEAEEVGPHYWVRTAKVASVSIRKEIGLPATITVKLSPHRVMAEVRSQESGLLQSTVASSRRSNQGIGGVDGPLA